MRPRLAVLLVGAVAAAVLAACGATGLRPPDGRVATYVIEGRRVTLAHGVASAPAAPGAASRVRTWIAAGPVAGRLTGGRGPDAALVLAQETGGSGTFYYAAALLNDGSAGGRATNAVFLGDRVAVTGLSLGGGVISVRLLVRRSDQPMAAAPSVATVRRFRVAGDRLVAAG